MENNVVFKWVEEMKVIQSGTSIWIGISDRNRENLYAYNSSGEMVSFANWQSDHPNASFGDDVAIMPNGKWITFSCENQRLFICELPLTE